MGLSLTVLLIAFGLILAVELPDKTLVATVLLSARYRPWPVLLGVAAAFVVQCVIAVAFGGVLTLLPPKVVAAVVALLFAIGAFVLLKEGFGRREPEEEGVDIARRAEASGLSFWRTAFTAFGVLVIAEFGDASQLATAALTARYKAPIEVGIGSWLALVLVAAVAVAIGKKVGDRVPRRLLHQLSGMVFAALAALAVVQGVIG
jgi:Ca2+/H+ antiporter, TMEM165/GDT1 family